MRLWWRFIREKIGTAIAGASYGILRSELAKCKIQSSKQIYDSSQQLNQTVNINDQLLAKIDGLERLLAHTRLRAEKLEPLAVIVTNEECPQWSEDHRKAFNVFINSEVGTRLMEIWEWYCANQAIVATQQAVHTKHANGIAIGMREFLQRNRQLFELEKDSHRDDALITRLESRRHKAPDRFSYIAP